MRVRDAVVVPCSGSSQIGTRSEASWNNVVLIFEVLIRLQYCHVLYLLIERYIADTPGDMLSLNTKACLVSILVSAMLVLNFEPSCYHLVLDFEPSWCYVTFLLQC